MESFSAQAGAWAGLPTIHQRAIFSENSVRRVLIKMFTNEDRFSCELHSRLELGHLRGSGRSDQPARRA